MDSLKITIKDVAKRAGVSIATVSRYLNNPTSLRDKNLKKVETAVKELNYHPHVYARRLAGGKLNSYGLIIPGYRGIFYSYYALELIRGVGMTLDKEGLDLHLHIFWDKDNFKTSLVDGAIFADIVNNEHQLRRLVREGTPVVVINRRMDDPDISFVAIDNFKGAIEATEFLINHNHKRIAHLAGDLRIQCAQERLDGYKAALEKNQIPVDDELIKLTNFSRKDAREKLDELFALSSPPTAVFCCSDEVAREVIVYCEEKGVHVPQQMSIVGFDDNPYCTYGSVMLTTVRQPLKTMASVGVEVLDELIEHKAGPQRIVLETELVIRDTVQFL